MPYAIQDVDGELINKKKYMGRVKRVTHAERHDPFHRALCKRITFHATRVAKHRYVHYKQQRHWKREVYKWLKGAVLQYRNWYRGEECTIIIDCNLSNSITFLTQNTLEYIRHVELCRAWDAFLLTDPTNDDRRRVLRDVYDIFCKKHPSWSTKWHGVDEKDDHVQNSDVDKPYVEVDGQGTVWAFSWCVNEK